MDVLLTQLQVIADVFVIVIYIYIQYVQQGSTVVVVIVCESSPRGYEGCRHIYHFVEWDIHGATSELTRTREGRAGNSALEQLKKRDISSAGPWFPSGEPVISSWIQSIFIDNTSALEQGRHKRLYPGGCVVQSVQTDRCGRWLTTRRQPGMYMPKLISVPAEDDMTERLPGQDVTPPQGWLAVGPASQTLVWHRANHVPTSHHIHVTRLIYHPPYLFFIILNASFLHSDGSLWVFLSSSAAILSPLRRCWWHQTCRDVRPDVKCSKRLSTITYPPAHWVV